MDVVCVATTNSVIIMGYRMIYVIYNLPMPGKLHVCVMTAMNVTDFPTHT